MHWHQSWTACRPCRVGTLRQLSQAPAACSVCCKKHLLCSALYRPTLPPSQPAADGGSPPVRSAQTSFLLNPRKPSPDSLADMASLPPTEGRVPLHSPKASRHPGGRTAAARRHQPPLPLQLQIFLAALQLSPRPSTLQGSNKRIQDATVARVRKAAGAGPQELGRAITRLQSEWDMVRRLVLLPLHCSGRRALTTGLLLLPQERTLEFNASCAAGLGERREAVQGQLRIRTTRGPQELRPPRICPNQRPPASSPLFPSQAWRWGSWATAAGSGSPWACSSSWLSTPCRAGAPRCPCSGGWAPGQVGGPAGLRVRLVPVLATRHANDLCQPSASA